MNPGNDDGLDTDLDSLYRHRFAAHEIKAKHAIWRVLCERFFSRYVQATDTVVDIGAGYCEFINHIPAGKKIAVDLNPDAQRYAAQDVRVVNASSTNLDPIDSGSVDVVFMSNFLEHLPNKKAVLDTFRECFRILRTGGQIVVLQPNVRYLPGEYWDFFDHHTPLTERSVAEGLALAGFEPHTVVARFLPYTTKSRLPKAPWLVALYLKIPLVWRVLGKQALVIATKPGSRA